MPECYKELFKSAERQYFDLSYAWFQNLERKGINHAFQPFIYTVDNKINNKSEVVLPLMKKVNAKLRSLSSYYSVHYYPILKDENQYDGLVYIFRHIRYEKENHNLLELSPFPAEKNIYRITKSSLRRAGWVVFPELYNGNFFLPVNGSYSDYYQNLPSKLRHTIERKKKKFYSDENRKITLYTDEAQILQAIDKYTTVYQRSWKEPEPFSDFIPSLIRFFARKNELRLGFVFIDDEPVAAQIWIVKNNVASIYKLAYDLSYANLSVGSLLTDHMMKYVIESDKVSEVDFLVGDEEYKKDWMTHRRELWKISAYNPRTIWGIYLIFKGYLKNLAKEYLKFLF